MDDMGASTHQKILVLFYSDNEDSLPILGQEMPRVMPDFEIRPLSETEFPLWDESVVGLRSEARRVGFNEIRYCV